MVRIECAHNSSMHIRMRECEAQEESSAAFAWLAQFIQIRFLKFFPSIFVPQPNAHLSPCHTATDDRPDARLGSTADPLLMLPLQSRIWDLEGIEYAPLEINGQMRQGRGNGNEAHFALLLHLLESIHQLVLLCDVHGRVMQLHNVDMVGFHALEAFV